MFQTTNQTLSDSIREFPTTIHQFPQDSRSPEPIRFTIPSPAEKGTLRDDQGAVLGVFGPSLAGVDLFFS